MPRRKVYVREDDEELWDNTPDRADMVAWALRNWPKRKAIQLGPKTEDEQEPVLEPLNEAA